MNTSRTTRKTRCIYLSLAILIMAAAIWLVPGYLSSTELVASTLPEYLSEVPAGNEVYVPGPNVSPLDIELAAALEHEVYMPLGADIPLRNTGPVDAATAHAPHPTTVSQLLGSAPQCGIASHRNAMADGHEALALNCTGGF